MFMHIIYVYIHGYNGFCCVLHTYIFMFHDKIQSKTSISYFRYYKPIVSFMEFEYMKTL